MFKRNKKINKGRIDVKKCDMCRGPLDEETASECCICGSDLCWDCADDIHPVKHEIACSGCIEEANQEMIMASLDYE